MEPFSEVVARKSPPSPSDRKQLRISICQSCGTSASSWPTRSSAALASASSSSSSSQQAATDASSTNIRNGSEAVALAPSGLNLLPRHPRGPPSRTRFEKPPHRKFPFGTCCLRRRQVRDDSAMARDGNRRTTFNPAKELGQVGLRLRCLNLLNHVYNRLFQPGPTILPLCLRQAWRCPCCPL